MASKSKKKTTMAKLNRERRLVERRHAKQAKKIARKQAALHPAEAGVHSGEPGEPAEPAAPEEL